jgi:hypothetical protein
LKGATIVCLHGAELNFDDDLRPVRRPQSKHHSRVSGFVLVPGLGIRDAMMADE